MPEQLSLFHDGRHLRDKGIARAAQHAEDVEPDWQEKALDFLRTFAQERSLFSGEMVREASHASVPEPPHLRAWGAIMLTAAKRGWIVKDGYIQVQNPRAHRANAALWKSRIYKEPFVPHSMGREVAIMSANKK